MCNHYSPDHIEKKWQTIWDEEKAFKVEIDKTKEKLFALVEFPYPSGQGLHVGHTRPYTALDIIARKKRMEGINVLYPMGWDAFGLPTENYAIQNKIHPKVVTENNIKNFKGQLQAIGYSFDWDREINTTDPNYYKWTQWIFLKLFEKGLAYKSEMPINWCNSCKVGLANEEVVAGGCERCGGEVVRKVRSQWMLKITEYADRLIDDLSEVDYLEKIKTSQINWIGRSIGAEVKFNIANKEDELVIFTTRPDTLFGATYMVISPEHPYIEKYKSEISNYDALIEYRDNAAKKSDFERTELVKDKTGVEIQGLTAINPVNGKELPIWISDYVLMTYGTGAIMAVPAHDERDWEFAKKFNLPIVEVVAGGDVQEAAFTNTATGTLVNSDFLNGLEVADAKEAIINWLNEKAIGKKKVNHKLRDWVFSRQRYWGEPIPLVHCECCGQVPLPESQLPLTLPEVETYMPTDNGESPLAEITDWVNTTCPNCGKAAKRETDTMPQWAGSSWYYLRYMDTDNADALASKEALEYWGPVDWYNGGMEHTTLHLLYSRFWHKFLYDIGVVNSKEPYAKRTAHGMILASDGQKMSKSRGNVVNPNDIINEYGSDTLRTYIMFIGAFELAASWSMDGVKGCRRFLDRVWKLQENVVDSQEISTELEKNIHKTIKKVSEDYDAMKFNTAIAAMMTLVNDMYKAKSLTKGDLKVLALLLNPVAPHITEEMWANLGGSGRVYQQTWPTYDEAKTKDDAIEIGVQVNGKLKGTVMVAVGATFEDIKDDVYAIDTVKAVTEGKQVVKEIYVPGKIINVVVK